MRIKEPQPVDVRVGQMIRTQRLTQGMSQTVLGSKIGVTFQQVQKYEKGRNRIGASRLTQIAKALSIDPASFFPDDDQSGGEDVLSLLQSTDAVELVKAFAKIESKQVRTAIVHVVTGVASMTLEEVA